MQTITWVFHCKKYITHNTSVLYLFEDSKLIKIPTQSFIFCYFNFVYCKIIGEKILSVHGGAEMKWQWGIFNGNAWRILTKRKSRWIIKCLWNGINEYIISIWINMKMNEWWLRFSHFPLNDKFSFLITLFYLCYSN